MKKLSSLSIFISISFILGVALRLWGLDTSLGRADENQNILDYGHSSFSHIATSYTYGGHHILNSLAIRLSILLFGEDNAIGIRAPVFLLGIATLFLTYLVAVQIFKSRFIGLISLFALAINPVHIQYSQIARGYGWIMFSSIFTLYALLKLFETKNQNWIWGIVIGGFVGVYAIPTNAYFIMALAAWSILIAWKYLNHKKHLDSSYYVPHPVYIFTIFLGIGLLSLAAYWPVLGNMFAEVKNYHLPKIAQSIPKDTPFSSILFAFGTITGFFKKTFPDTLLICSVFFILIGIFFTTPARKEYRFFPFFLLGVPALIAWVTGVVGYPRNYLFNLPWAMIFLAAGLHQAGEWIAKRIANANHLFLKTVFFAIWSIVSLHYLLFEFYPNQIIHNGPTYKRLTDNNTNQNDLILISKSTNYLYARQVYKKRLINIIKKNKLEGLKVIAGQNYKWNDHVFIRSNLGVIPLRGFKKTKPKTELTENRFLYSIFEKPVKGFLPVDFESKTKWNIISGSGKFNSTKSPKLFGEKSLSVTASGEGLYGYTVFPEIITVEKPSLAVLVWSGKNALGRPRIVHPEIAFIARGGNNVPQQLPLVELNDGIHVTTPESQSIFADNWQLLSNIAPIDPGAYSLTLWLKVVPNESYFYDGFRFFILPLP